MRSLTGGTASARARKPLEFRTPRGRLLASLLGWGGLSAFLGLIWLLVLAAMLFAAPRPGEDQGQLARLVALAMWMLFGLLVFGFMGWCWLDRLMRLVRNGPVLAVDGEGLTVRSGSPREVRVPWDEVAYLDSLRFAPRRYQQYHMNEGLRIVLRPEARCVSALRKIVLRFGVWFGLQGLIVGADELPVPVDTAFGRVAEYRRQGRSANAGAPQKMTTREER